MKGYEYQSPFAKKYYAQGRSEGRTEGLDEGLKFATSSLLTVLRLRGIDVPEPVRERFLASRDLAQLQRWLERSVVALSLADVLDEPS